MKKGLELNYFGKPCKVVDFDNTHVVIIFENGTQICTNINTFENQLS